MSDATAAIIPQELLVKLVTLRPRLFAGGCVQPHRNGFRIRYRQFDQAQGFTVHRSLAIGDDKAVAAAVQALIDNWREEQDRIAVQSEAARQLEAASDEHNRQLVAGIVRLHGGGKRRQRRAVKQFDAALASGPRDLFLFAAHADFLKRGKPGPPCKRLW